MHASSALSAFKCAFYACLRVTASPFSSLPPSLSLYTRMLCSTHWHSSIWRAVWLHAVTGAAHSVLAPFWLQLLGRGAEKGDHGAQVLRARQCSPRGMYPPSSLAARIVFSLPLPLPPPAPSLAFPVPVRKHAQCCPRPLCRSSLVYDLCPALSSSRRAAGQKPVVPSRCFAQCTVFVCRGCTEAHEQ